MMIKTIKFLSFSLLVFTLLLSFTARNLRADDQQISLTDPLSLIEGLVWQEFEFKLRFVDKLNASLTKPIEYKVYYSYISSTSSYIDCARNNTDILLKIEFPNPTKHQFDQLKLLYKTFEDLEFREDRIYQLEDFLPRTVQVTINRTYPSTETPDPQNPSHVRGSDTNCWGTAYEFLRDDRKNFCFFYEDISIHEFFLSNEEYFETVRTIVISNKQHISDKLRLLENLQFGDLILFKKCLVEELYHAAIVIDDNLIFEKVGVDEVVPYRFTTISNHEFFSGLRGSVPPDGKSVWPDGKPVVSLNCKHCHVTYKRKHTIMIRRLKKDLPHPEDLFADTIRTIDERSYSSECSD